MEITIKNNWKEVSIKDYLTIINLIDESEDLDKIELNNYLLTILTGLSLHQINNMSLKDYKFATKNIAFIYTQPTETVKNEYVINGKKYKLNKKISECVTGQYLDLLTLTKNIDNILPNIHKIIAIFLSPIDKKYGEYDLEEVANEFYEHLNIADAMAISLFFYHLENKLLEATQLYLEKQEKKAKKILKKAKKNNNQ